MTKYEFDMLYVGKRRVVHCDTYDKAKEFLTLAHKFGYRWWDDEEYLEYTNGIEREDNFYYNRHKKYTCYDINAGEYNHIYNYKDVKYRVVKYESRENI